jgi:hypothetical protein
MGDERRLDRESIIKMDYKGLDPTAHENKTFPFGAIVLAEYPTDDEGRVSVFYDGQILGRHKDGRYKVYHLNDGSFSYLLPHQMTYTRNGSFKSPSDAKLFDSCDEFYEMIMSQTNGAVYKRNLGDGCFLTASWLQGDGELTTLIATYDGQIHMDFNAYSSAELYQRRTDTSLITALADEEIEGTDKKQTDFHPRGYGRVVNFQMDLDQYYFGTKYPRPL